METRLGLTPKQKSVFWRAFTAAKWAVQPPDADAWRHQILMEETGKMSLLDIDRRGEFEAVMRRLWSEAGNWEEAARYTIGDERRAAFMIKVCAAQVLQLMAAGGAASRRATTSAPAPSAPSPAAYLAGVLRQSRLVSSAVAERDDFWMDIPLVNALKVFQMLDTHRRRLIKATGHGGKALAFSPNVRYRREGDAILILERVPMSHYAQSPQPFVQVRRDGR